MKNLALLFILCIALCGCGKREAAVLEAPKILDSDPTEILGKRIG